MNEHILIVEDEEDIIELIKYNLNKEGYHVSSCDTGTNAHSETKRLNPNLILLDLMLPGIDGLEVCKQLKIDPKTTNIPIIMLTAKSEEADIVSSLELGADDYITKPFSPRILLARIKSVLRRYNDNNSSENSSELQLGALFISKERREVRINDTSKKLTFLEFELLHLLSSEADRVWTRAQITERIHGHDYINTDRSIDVLIVSLRKKLESLADHIETIRGVGYKYNTTIDV